MYMLKLSKTLFNQPVISLRSGGQIAVATEPIINPHNLKILGWWCRERGHTKSMVLLSEDVRKLAASGLAVDSEEALSAPEDLVRHKEIMDIHFILLDILVRTDKRKLGKVSDFSYNDGLFVQKLYVAKPLAHVFTMVDTLLIDRSQIVEVTNQYILVNEADIKVTESELANAPDIAPAV